MLYFIKKQKGDSFNHKGLFIDHVHEVTARCKQITQIIFLNQEDFQRVLKQNKDEYVIILLMQEIQIKIQKRIFQVYFCFQKSQLFFQICEKNPPFNIKINQQKQKEYLDFKSRILQLFQNENYLVIIQKHKNIIKQQEKYCMIKDKFFSQSFSLGEKCLSCSEFNHSVLSCNFIKYSPNKSNLIAKNQYSVPIIERTREGRKVRNNKYNSRINNLDVKQSLRLLRLELTHMLMGQRIGSFSQLAEQDLTDEQFYKFFPQLSYDSERFIHISSADDLNRSFENQDCESIGNHIQQNQQLQPLIRESIQDQFLLKIRNDNGTHQQFMSQLSNQQSSATKLPHQEEISILSPNVKKAKRNTFDIHSSSEDNSEKEENVKTESQRPDIRIKVDGLQRQASIKFKENSVSPLPKSITPVNRRLSTLQGSANIFQSQQQGNNSFHNLLNYNQHPSHTEFNISNMPSSLAPPETAALNANNQLLFQIMNQLKQILNKNTFQTQLSGVSNNNSHHTNQNKLKGQNIRSLTNIQKDHVQQTATANNQSLQKIPTLQTGGGVLDKDNLFYLNNDFDLIKEYKFYFPSMNFSSVRHFYNQFQDKKFAKIRTAKTSIYKRI